MDRTAVTRPDESDNLLEKLSLQVQSFQEGFESLIKCRSINEMAKNFSRLLQVNFDLKDLYLLYKNSPSSPWEYTDEKIKPLTEDVNLLNDGKEYNLGYYEEARISASVTLPLSDSSALGILFGRKFDGSGLSAGDRITLQVLLQVFNSAHKAFSSQKKIKKLIFELNEKVFQLNNLIDSGIELSKFGKTSNLYQLALERVSSITNSSSALISIVSKTNPEENHFYTFPIGMDPFLIIESPKRIESSFELEDRIYKIVLSEKETRHGSEGFNELDKTLLNAITRQVSASIENEFWHNESLEKEKYQKELNVAASIQQQIIPKTLPQIPGYELAATNLPSQEVGGDYYDVINLGKNKYAFVIADVAGKGIGAALLVNTLSAALYSYLDFNLPLPEMSDKLNKLIYKSSPSDKYITFFIAVLDSITGQLDVVNAGHNPVLLKKHDGKVQEIPAGGVGLGMFDFGIPFNGETLSIEPGDKLFLYTDGIPEAMNEKEEEYSDEKMTKFFTEHCEMSAEDYVNLMINDVKEHTAGFSQSDDITMIMLKRNS